MSTKYNQHWKTASDEELIRMIETNLMSVSNLAGLFYPTERVAGGYLVELPEALDEVPIPPTHLRHNYGLKNNKYVDDLYISSGVNDVRSIREFLDEDGFDLSGDRILEFGCSAGRVLRHFNEEAKTAEVWGVDIHAEAIHWAQAHLQDFNFAVTTTAPHLPFEDNYFGVIFATSVFTHIGELDDAWLLELRRITRPGGRLYVTISDDNTLNVLRTDYPEHASNQHVDDFDAATGVLSKPYLQFVTRSTPWLQRVIYNRDRWVKKTSKWLEPRIVKTNASGWQSAVLFAKRDSYATKGVVERGGWKQE